MNVFHNKDNQSLELLKRLNVSLDTGCSYSIVEFSEELFEVAECNVMYEEQRKRGFNRMWYFPLRSCNSEKETGSPVR